MQIYFFSSTLILNWHHWWWLCMMIFVLIYLPFGWTVYYRRNFLVTWILKSITVWTSSLVFNNCQVDLLCIWLSRDRWWKFRESFFNHVDSSRIYFLKHRFDLKFKIVDLFLHFQLKIWKLISNVFFELNSQNFLILRGWMV